MKIGLGESSGCIEDEGSIKVEGRSAAMMRALAGMEWPTCNLKCPESW